jgi:hypothetical protein
MSAAVFNIGPPERHWVGQCQYPGKLPFFLGTVIAETESEALPKLEKLWSDISSHPMPPILSAIPGMLLIRQEGEDA